MDMPLLWRLGTGGPSLTTAHEPVQSLAGKGGGLSGDRYCLSLILGTLALDPHLTVEQIC